MALNSYVRLSKGVSKVGRVMFLIKCKPGEQEEYIRRHALLMDCRPDSTNKPKATKEEIEMCTKVWDLHKCAGIKNYSIFMKDNTLYAYMESNDYKKALDQVTRSEIGQKWQQFMNGIVEQENGVPVFDIIECEVFHMD